MRQRIVPFALLLVAFAAALPQFAHAAIPFFGPIIPQSWNQCAAGWGGVITVINNLIEFGITIAIVFVAPIMIAYAGFLLVVNPFASDAKSEARTILLNTVIGIVVALAAWLIVDAVMVALTSGGQFTQQWQSLISSGGLGPCLKLPTTQASASSAAPAVSGAGTTGVVSPNGAPQCSPSNTACSPAVLQNAGFNSAQANVMSCIAMTENSGNSAGCNGNACGTFQIMLSLNPLAGSACAAYPVTDCTGPSACNAVNGKAQNVSSPGCTSCIESEKQAASDPQCNAQAAKSMVSKSGYGPWTTGSDNTKSAACVQQYSNS